METLGSHLLELSAAAQCTTKLVAVPAFAMPAAAWTHALRQVMEEENRDDTRAGRANPMLGRWPRPAVPLYSQRRVCQNVPATSLEHQCLHLHLTQGSDRSCIRRDRHDIEKNAVAIGVAPMAATGAAYDTTCTALKQRCGHRHCTQGTKQRFPPPSLHSRWRQDLWCNNSLSCIRPTFASSTHRLSPSAPH